MTHPLFLAIYPVPRAGGTSYRISLGRSEKLMKAINILDQTITVFHAKEQFTSKNHPTSVVTYTNPKQAYLFSLPAYLVFLFNKKRKQESWLAIFRVNNRFHSVYVCGQRCMYCGYYIMDVFTPICEPFPQLPSYTTTPLPCNKKEF